MLRAALHVLDKSLGRFLATHTTSGITSGASMVNHLWEQQQTATALWSPILPDLEVHRTP
ncbi:hypothetical protein [Streptomyces sp. NPDC059256]|uniref:hypothetical protein n=1 Tax=Streptomyces sp. NPDC059256 TaxID=3346794 RepID=UPI0036BAE046